MSARPLALAAGLWLAGLAAAAADPAQPPADFTDKAAVLGAIDGLTAACTAADAADCKTRCETAKRLAASHLGKSKVQPVAVQNAWKPCREAYLATLVAAPGAIDFAKFSINGFVLMGDLRQQRDLFEMLEVRGWVKSTKTETTVRLRFKGKPEPDAKEPDIVLRYGGIVEEGGFTQVDATGDGRIWRIRHVQKGKVDPAAARAEAVKGFGEPHKTQGDMLMWGCEPANNEGCVIVEIMPHQVERRALDERIRPQWGRSYEDMVRKARS